VTLLNMGAQGACQSKAGLYEIPLRE
jgi:hypothetical protein